MVTEPEPEPEPAPPAFNLTGIMEVEGSFVALVNGRQVQAGDSVGEILIRRISRHAIVVEDENGKREIPVFSDNEDTRINSY